jgi:hypothetical protein
MARVSIELEGADRLARVFDRGSDAHRQALSKAMMLEANRILNESRKIVPFDTGVLKDSGAVEGPKVDSNGVEVEITYGGAAKAYAAVQHWDTSLNHPNGKQALYLLTPIEAAKSTFVRSLTESFAIYEYAGASPLEVMVNESATLERPSIQVLVRAARNDYPTARALAASVQNALVNIANEEISGQRFLRVHALSSVNAVGTDENHRPIFSLALQAVVER